MNEKRKRIKRTIRNIDLFGCPNCGPRYGYLWNYSVLKKGPFKAIICQSCGWMTRWHLSIKRTLREYAIKRSKKGF